MKSEYCKFYLKCRRSHHSNYLCRKNWLGCPIYKRLIKYENLMKRK